MPYLVSTPSLNNKISPSWIPLSSHALRLSCHLSNVCLLTKLYEKPLLIMLIYASHTSFNDSKRFSSSGIFVHWSAIVSIKESISISLFWFKIFLICNILITTSVGAIIVADFSLISINWLIVKAISDKPKAWLEKSLFS